ncbi:Uncharacterised protein [Bordetella ansorpii]|uniref:Lipoprotein n=1 Tax=Bordetella ansorpii TaxID=288768 RepID=A0A157RLP0_9BORD|nr:Uncharacterised protein [Bordetella ansorpii]
MTPNNARPLRLLMLMPLLLLAAGCGSESTRWLPTQSPAIPPLPTEARQPEPPSICSPTCSARLSILLENWLNMPTGRATPD